MDEERNNVYENGNNTEQNPAGTTDNTDNTSEGYVPVENVNPDDVTVEGRPQGNPDGHQNANPYSSGPYGYNNPNGNPNGNPHGNPNGSPYNNPYNNPNNNGNGGNKKSKVPIIILCVVGIVAVVAIFAALVFGMIRIVGQNMNNLQGNDIISEIPGLGGDEDAVKEPEVEEEPESDPITTTEPVKVNESDSKVYGAADVSGIVEKVMPSVVTITSTSSVQGYSIFGEKVERQYDATGTGFIVGQNNKELLIATNNHVVEGATAVQVTFTDDESAEAAVKGTDAKADLAVVAVKLSDLSDDTQSAIKVAVLGDSDALKVGEVAIVIGNARGMGQSVTVGCISAKDRELALDDGAGGTKTMNFIQTDAAINGGNSGGPLLDINGNVVGISTAKITDTQVEGMCFAIPISSAKPIINELMNRETLKEDEKGYMGASFQEISQEAVKMYGVPDGVYVQSVVKGGPADKAGIKAGDIITEIDSFAVNSYKAAAEKIQSNRAGSEITVKAFRQNSSNGFDEMTFTVKLATAKEVGISSSDPSSGNRKPDADRDDDDRDDDDRDDDDDDNDDDDDRNYSYPDDPYDDGRDDDWFEDMFPW